MIQGPPLWAPGEGRSGGRGEVRGEGRPEARSEACRIRRTVARSQPNLRTVECMPWVPQGGLEVDQTKQKVVGGRARETCQRGPVPQTWRDEARTSPCYVRAASYVGAPSALEFLDVLCLRNKLCFRLTRGLQTKGVVDVRVDSKRPSRVSPWGPPSMCLPERLEGRMPAYPCARRRPAPLGAQPLVATPALVSRAETGNSETIAQAHRLNFAASVLPPRSGLQQHFRKPTVGRSGDCHPPLSGNA